MKLIKLRMIFITLAISCFLSGNLFAQQNLEFLSYKLPRKDKKNLIKSIDVFTQKMRNKEWSEVYDLISNRLKENWDSKEEFIQWQNEDKGYFVTGFKANENSILVWNNEKMRESVHLLGCLSAIEKGKRIKYWGTIEAERNGSDKWAFSSLPIINPNGLSGGRKPC
jgi:hypothetical protein